MKSLFIKILATTCIAATLGACANPQGGLTQSQANTMVGAAIGGMAGNAIGGNTSSTLGGAALGAVIGSQINR